MGSALPELRQHVPAVVHGPLMCRGATRWRGCGWRWRARGRRSTLMHDQHAVRADAEVASSVRGEGEDIAQLLSYYWGDMAAHDGQM
jgi:hypothetical protein